MKADGLLRVRRLGRRNYRPVWEAMRRFTAERSPDQPDELWLVEHGAVFTLGRNAREEHLLAPGNIPVVKVDRGGQVTYHGPGQIVAYPLVDLRRRGMGVRHLVTALEQSVIDFLATFAICADRREDAPGVYVDGAKIASLGLRIRQGRSYHGLSLNVDMDLEPFGRINPCGYPGLNVSQLRDWGITASLPQIGDLLAEHLARSLGYDGIQPEQEPQ